MTGNGTRPSNPEGDRRWTPPRFARPVQAARPVAWTPATNAVQETRYALALLGQVRARFPRWAVWRDRTGLWSATRGRYGGLTVVTARSHIELLDRLGQSEESAATQPFSIERASR